MTSPTPIDNLVWSYHQLGWSTRRIAGECNTSQASVVRILDRLKKEPPAAETMIMTGTPPGGLSPLHALPQSWVQDYDDAPARRDVKPQGQRGIMWLTILNLVLLGVLVATLAAVAGGLIAKGKTGPAGPAGPAGAPAKARHFTLCVHTSNFSGAVISLTAPDKNGSCGTGTTVRIPG